MKLPQSKLPIQAEPKICYEAMKCFDKYLPLALDLEAAVQTDTLVELRSLGNQIAKHKLS